MSVSDQRLGLRGTPMYKRAAEKKRMFVYAEYGDGTYLFHLWSGWTVSSIKKAAKAKYPDAKLWFGNWF